jgi:hypothetical protein
MMHTRRHNDEEEEEEEEEEDYSIYITSLSGVVTRK